MHAKSLPGLAPLEVGRLPWKPTSVPGVFWIPLYLEAERGPRAAPGATPAPAASSVLIRMEPGSGYPRHVHVDGEEVLCLSGGYQDELGTVRAGDYVRYPAGSAHTPVALPGDVCVLFASARGGVLLEAASA
jgi:anti-sigma factor ChrR (cupin superfamily)